MNLNKLAMELDETVRLSGEMVAELNDGLAMLLADMTPIEAAKNPAIKTMIMAMQMQDRIEQRSRGLIAAAKTIIQQAENGGACQGHTGSGEKPEKSRPACDPWSTQVLEELRPTNAPGKGSAPPDIELF
ncbi:MAG: hypothetical protein GXP01_11090 [Alphaproteobacteria bacterium]|nr:hypothetical protein [Alphaproteobacteria bacterium]